MDKDTDSAPAPAPTYEERLIIANRQRSRKITFITLATLILAGAGFAAYWTGLVPSFGGFENSTADHSENPTPPPDFNPAPFLTLDDNAQVSLRQEIARQAALLNSSYETETDKAALTAVEFLTARSIDERLPWVRQPERVAPLMREYYARPDISQAGFKKVVGRAKLTVAGREVITVNYSTTDNETLAIALLRDGENQRFLVDWESAVCYSGLPARKFLAEKPTTPTTFRLYANIGDYYNYQFSDATQYRCLTLEDRDKSFLLYGYVQRDAPWLKEAFPSLEPVADPRPLTLKISFPENPSADNLVHIDEYVTAWWFAK